MTASNQSSEVVSLELAQRRQAGALLARAFHEDALYRHAIPDEGKRSALLTWLFGRVVHYALLYGHVHTTLALQGAACWLPPGRTEVTLGRVVRSGLYATPLKMGWAAYRRFSPYAGYSSKLHHHCAPQPHWYLWAIGVDPPSQGRGVGNRLLEPTLRRADEDGIACYLETVSEKNVGFYEKHGFEVVSEGQVPQQGLQVRAMRRGARKVAR